MRYTDAIYLLGFVLGFILALVLAHHHSSPLILRVFVLDSVLGFVLDVGN
ncbi:MAG: hypothetical protein HRU23_10020 [Gammaproteobacteria bacterium]|nr:hypothetical protein [Gammaproteobacteria bacterium]